MLLKCDTRWILRNYYLTVTFFFIIFSSLYKVLESWFCNVYECYQKWNFPLFSLFYFLWHNYRFKGCLPLNNFIGISSPSPGVLYPSTISSLCISHPCSSQSPNQVVGTRDPGKVYLIESSLHWYFEQGFPSSTCLQKKGVWSNFSALTY